MTRMYIRLALLVALASGATLSQADLLGIRIRAGLHWTSNFDLRNGGTGHLEGPELGADFPMSNMFGLPIYMSPSIVWGGRLRHGADIDGNVYRFMLTTRKAF